MKVVVVVPTYNEALNLPLLVPRLRGAAPEAEILVVDDGSPDGTAQVAEGLGVRVLNRTTKSGRGGAVLAGLTHAKESLDVDWFCEMDADLSHLPEELDRFLAVAEGADMVVGSRYLPGGLIVGRSWRRNAWSLMSNWIIKTVLRIPMSDFTNGYRLYSRRAVEHLASRRLRETGYISLSEWAYVLHRGGMTIREVPTTFGQPGSWCVEHVSIRSRKSSARPDSHADPSTKRVLIMPPARPLIEG